MLFRSALSGFQTWIPAVYGALIIAVILILPGGIAGLITRLEDLLTGRTVRSPARPRNPVAGTVSVGSTGSTGPADLTKDVGR